MHILSKSKVVFASIIGVLFYLGLYFYAANSEAFLSAKKEIFLSKQIALEVGRIKKVELPLFGLFKFKSYSSATKTVHTAYLKMKVVGAIKTITFTVIVKNTKGEWKVQKVAYEGRRISL